MQIPVLFTRFHPPALTPELIGRPVLLEKMDRSSMSKLILLSAPAGYGKTTLANQWLRMQSRDYIWLSIDDIHRDPRVFLQYLFTALAEKFKAFDDPFWQIPRLQNEWDPFYLLGHLVNHIEKNNLDFILALDDYHIVDIPEINQILEFLLDNLPGKTSLLITSRTDPSLPLTKMRAKGELAFINLNDLQFSESETLTIFRQESQSDLPDDDVRKICLESEGWITGIRLALMALTRNSGNPHKYVKEYLFEEILEKEDDDLISFLLRTSILTYLNAFLCDALLADEQVSSEAMLRELLKKNLFIQEVESEGNWFRLHPLFLDVLREKRDSEVGSLHLRAASWFRENKQYSECFRHFFSSGDLGKTINYLEQCWPEMEQSFNFHSWLGWAEELPEEEIMNHPLLLSQIAWARLSLGQLKLAEITLKKTEAIVRSGNSDPAVLIQIYSAWSYFFFIKRDLENTVKYAEKMESLIDESNSFFLIQARSYKALAYWFSGELDRAFVTFSDFRDEMIAAGVPAFALGAYMALIQIRMRQGWNSEALKLFREAVEMETGEGAEINKVKASLHLKSAAIFFDRGEQEAVEEQLRLSQNLSAKEGLVDYYYQYHQFLALIYESSGQWEKALEALNDASHLFVQTPAIDDISIMEHKIRVWIRMGKKTTARKALLDLIGNDQLKPSFRHESKLLIHIRYTLAFFKDTSELSELLDILNQLTEKARSENRLKSLVEIFLLTACTLHGLNMKNESCEILSELLELAEKCGFFQIFLMETDLLKPLFSDFSGRLKTNEDYRNIADFMSHNERHSLLSSREREVLKLMAMGMSNRKIGEKLFVAESTVKGHNQRIFQKLNVANRTEAISEGRKTGLID